MASTGVVIVGGGVIGCSIAYHLRRAGFPDSVVIVERDPSYRRASSRLAFGGIRQQYATEVNARMAQRSVEFYRRFDEEMAVDGRSANGRFRPRGYLFLADSENAESFSRRFEKMRSVGVAVEKVARDRMLRLVPGMNVSDIEFGLFGPQDGYGDPIGVLAGFRAKTESLGVEFVAGDLESVDVRADRIAGVRAGGRTIATERLVCAAGAFSRRVGELVGVSIPVSPVRQQLVRAALPRPWPFEFPVVIDPTGVHWRSAEGNAIVIAKTETTEPEGENFGSDPDRLAALQPVLTHRVPGLFGLETVSTWAGLYEMTADHNGLLGEHPERPGLFLACGFSGHGLMMAPATGEILASMLMDREPFVDVSALSVDRFRSGRLFQDEAMI
ncbi:MAG: NAD(P)/FAD-dependent oxidoreductase [Thermoanaerobaculia bacterium]